MEKKQIVKSFRTLMGKMITISNTYDLNLKQNEAKSASVESTTNGKKLRSNNDVTH